MLNIEKHRQIMFLILNDIFKSGIFNLAFKWWTLAYFLYWLDRFSTDLDFDLLENVNIDDSLLQILKKYGKIKKKSKIILSYGDWEDNIKIDISRKIWINNEYEIVNFFWNNMKVQTKSTLFTNKLVALVERNTNRDIYDVWFFMKNNFDINDRLIYERTWKTRKELFLQILNKLNKLWTNYKILDWLGEVLDEEQKKYIKTHLLDELIWMINLNLKFL